MTYQTNFKLCSALHKEQEGIEEAKRNLTESLANILLPTVKAVTVGNTVHLGLHVGLLTKDQLTADSKLVGDLDWQSLLEAATHEGTPARVTSKEEFIAYMSGLICRLSNDSIKLQKLEST